MQLAAALATLALCGCNQIFGLDATKNRPPVDAQYFDAPIDAPFACPALGKTPTFAPVVHQIDPPRCNEMTLGGDVAAAMCSGGISVGALGDNTFTLVNLGKLFSPRLTPEGDTILATSINPSSLYANLEFLELSTGTWTNAGSLTGIQLGQGFLHGVPSAGPTRRLMLIDSGTLHELSVDATRAATIVKSYAATEFDALVNVGGYFASAPNLSPDGLRMTLQVVINGGDPVNMYADRASVQDYWAPASLRPLPGAPNSVSDLFMTPDCARIYFSGIELLFWEQQSGVQ